MNIDNDALLKRFMSYIKIDTQSDDNITDAFPSTEKQFVLANLLVEELKSIGLADVTVDEYGYVMATIPSNTNKKVPTIGFLAHMDTSPDMSGKDVNPRVIDDYNGDEIVLNKDLNIILSPNDFPELLDYKGKSLIVTDGTTLLGADDKAGIAEIMTAVEYMVNNPDFKHGAIRIAFTVDEEVGRGVDHFDVEKFSADFAYTLDGGGLGELEYENFNAAGIKVSIQGKNIHPGYAKNKMLNAIVIGQEFNSMLPPQQRPEHTQDYEGFYHLYKFNAEVEKAEMQYIVRDHDLECFKQKKNTIEKIAEYLNDKYGDGVVALEISDQYYNMKEKIEPVMHIVSTAIEAMEQLGIKPKVMPIRGGTDGARLSFMGLPCPNIFAGGENFHGKYEYVPIESMLMASKTMLKIIQLFEQKA